MTIQPLSAGLGTGAMSSSISSIAEHAKGQNFQQMLERAERLEEKTGKHIVNAQSLSAQDKQLKEACKGFESMFLSLMYKEMRNTVPKDPLFGESNAMSIFKDFQDTEMMKNVAESGGIGLADMLYKQLSPQVLAQDKAARAKLAAQQSDAPKKTNTL